MYTPTIASTFCYSRLKSTYRIKESRLLAEFRGIEAFYEPSDDESADEKDDPNSRRLPLDAYLDNTVYETGRLLQLAAEKYSLEHGYKPTIRLRLTRLSAPLDGISYDERILHNITSLQSLGIILDFGPVDTIAETDSPAKSLLSMPHTGVNLDLSMLIALVTDITHYSLPKTDEEADERFRPQAERSWKRQIEKNPDIPEDAIEHCRALANQTRHEMKHALMQSLLAQLQDRIGNEGFKFWTTAEARDRFFTIVDKIGGKLERERARALFSENSGAYALFWQGSRLKPEERLDFLPVRILPTQDDIAPNNGNCDLFYDQMIITCRSILNRPTRPEPVQDDGERKLSAPTRFAARLSAHTVQSLLYGALNRMVTLTSNKSSVKSLLREMRGFALPSARRDDQRTDDSNTTAAIWVLVPRSLAEGMRADSEDAGVTS